MSWLALVFAFEIGFLPMGTVETYDYHIISTNSLAGDYYATLAVEAILWDFLFIGGDVRTEMKRLAGSRDFCPHTTNYGFEAGVRLEPIEIGFRHRCIHPVVPWLRNKYSKYIDNNWEGAYEEIYLRLEAELRPSR